MKTEYLTCNFIRELATSEPYNNNPFTDLDQLTIFRESITRIHLQIHYFKERKDPVADLAVFIQTNDKIKFPVCTSHFNHLNLFIGMINREMRLNDCKGKFYVEPAYDQSYDDPLDTFVLRATSSSISIKDITIQDLKQTEKET